MLYLNQLAPTFEVSIQKFLDEDYGVYNVETNRAQFLIPKDSESSPEVGGVNSVWETDPQGEELGSLQGTEDGGGQV